MVANWKFENNSYWVRIAGVGQNLRDKETPKFFQSVKIRIIYNDRSLYLAVIEHYSHANVRSKKAAII